MNGFAAICMSCEDTQCPVEGCLKYQRASRYFRESNLDRPYWTFDKMTLVANKDKEAFRRLATIERSIVQWVANGQQLLLHSDICGNGKTCWARRLLISYFKQSMNENRVNAGLFISMFEFLDRQRDDIDCWDEEFQPLKKRLLTADLVVWDDLATAPLSRFAMASITNIIDTRINRKLSNIYTTNLHPDSEQMKQAIGVRLWDRVSKLSECIEFVDEGKRAIHGNTANPI